MRKNLKALHQRIDNILKRVEKIENRTEIAYKNPNYNSDIMSSTYSPLFRYMSIDKVIKLILDELNLEIEEIPEIPKTYKLVKKGQIGKKSGKSK